MSAAVPAVMRTRLRNGMTVLVDDTGRPGLSCVALAVAAGAGADPPGRRGLAHLVEHLMFARHEQHAVNGHLAAVAGLGGTTNAVTHRDHTLFHSAFPTSELPTMLSMEADRVRSLAASDARLAAEKPIVATEIEGAAAHIGGSPWQPLAERLLSDPALYPVAHGRVAELAEIDAADCATFIDEHYHPANLVLTVCGDVPADAVLAMVQEWFVDLPERGARRHAAGLATAIQVAATPPARRLPLPPSGNRAAAMGFLLPDVVCEPDRYVATVLLAAVMSGSRIPQLVRDSPTLASASFECGYQGGWMRMRAPELGAARVLLRPGWTEQDGIALLEKELESIGALTITEHELRAAANRLLLDHYQDVDHLLSRTMSLATREVLFGERAGVDTLPERLATVTAQDVGQAATELLNGPRIAISGPGDGVS